MSELEREEVEEVAAVLHNLATLKRQRRPPSRLAKKRALNSDCFFSFTSSLSVYVVGIHQGDVESAPVSGQSLSLASF